MKLAVEAKRREKILAICLVLPAILSIGLLMLYPTFYNFWISLTNRTLFSSGNFIGVQNYLKILSSHRFWNGCINDLIFTFCSLFFQLIFGSLLALMLNHPMKGRGILRSFIILPWTISVVILSVIWSWMLHPSLGIVNQTLVKLGLLSQPISFFATPFLSMGALIAAMVWRGIPFITISILAGLQGIPRVYYEVAFMNGASQFQIIRYVLFPALRNLIGIIAVLRIMWMFNFFSIVWLVTGGGPARSTETLPVTAYLRGFRTYKMGEAATITTIMFFILLLFAMVYFWIQRQNQQNV